MAFLIGIIVINIYSLLGGLRGVITIDIMQFLIFFHSNANFICVVYELKIQILMTFINTISFSKFNVEFNFVIIVSLLISSLMPDFAPPLTQRLYDACT